MRMILAIIGVMLLTILPLLLIADIGRFLGAW
jgi:hypothetical protein